MKKNNKKLTETIKKKKTKSDVVRKELQIVKDELKADKEEQKFLVVIGELVSNVNEKIYYVLIDDDTPEIKKLPLNVCSMRFFKNAFTKYRPFLITL